MEDADLTWRTASYSSNGGGNCVEVAGGTRRVLVRDTQDRTGPVLRFASAAWRNFADQVKRSLASEALPGFAGHAVLPRARRRLHLDCGLDGFGQVHAWPARATRTYGGQVCCRHRGSGAS